MAMCGPSPDVPLAWVQENKLGIVFVFLSVCQVWVLLAIKATSADPSQVAKKFGFWYGFY